MCRNIKPLFNYAPPATQEEIRAASIQYVRKLSGIHKLSDVNEKAFNTAVDEIAIATQTLLSSLHTHAKPKNREEEAKKAHARNLKRFAN